ncbi:MAG: hypothetical protein DHS20C11_02830 [Lysobacteraceae bacterium]|nr:MAG: hypothetical protein DHS20C11_02830 [Xanthomonadaceae bacterium]
MNKVVDLWGATVARLDGIAAYLPAFLLRAILFHAFWTAGMKKLNGNNWFGRIQDNFPFPFNSISADLSWLMATWGEIIFSVLLLLGLFTRFAAFSLIMITVVAVAAVHWPGEWASIAELWKGYEISDKGFGNFKLPLLYFLMLITILFAGPGKLSLDALLRKLTDNPPQSPIIDPAAIALAAAAIGVPMLMLIPSFAIGLLVLAAALGAWAFKTR